MLKFSNDHCQSKVKEDIEYRVYQKYDGHTLNKGQLIIHKHDKNSNNRVQEHKLLKSRYIQQSIPIKY